MTRYLIGKPASKRVVIWLTNGWPVTLRVRRDHVAIGRLWIWWRR